MERFYGESPESDGSDGSDYEPEDVDDEVAGGEERPVNGQLFTCECGASFLRFPGYERHLDYGRCKVKPERITMIDYAAGLFKRNLEDLSQTRSLISMQDSFVKTDPSYPVPSEGWAMRAKKAGGHLPPNAKKIVEEYFEETQAADERCYPVPSSC